MKGRTTIKLTNVETGEVQKYYDCNMFTNALDEVFNKAPYYFANPTLANLTNSQFQTKNPLAPVAGNALGGLLLFPEAIEEDATTLYAPDDNKPTGIASFDAYSGADSRRGSINEIASGPVTGGYLFVWDFNQNQANGNIACACLTSKRGGAGYLNGDNNLLQDESSQGAGAGAGFWELNGTASSIPLGADDTGFYIFNGSNQLVKFEAPIRKIALNDSTVGKDGKVIGTVTNPGTKVLKDGELWNIRNSANASGNATLTIEKYNLTTWNMTTQTLVVPAKLEASDRAKVTCIVDGYLYMVANGGLNVIKINLATPADVAEIEDVFTNNRVSVEKNMMEFEGGVLSKRARIHADGTVEALTWDTTPVALIGTWMINAGSVNAYENIKLCATVYTPYLATINNLQNPIVKNPQQTMKVSYLVTEA